MTIKQLGGVFGRNPTFNDVTIEGELTFDVMEKPKSVHISREYYRWNMEKNEANKNLIKQTLSLF